MSDKKHTVKTIQEMKDKKEIITMLTAYDYPTAKQINDAGIDMILVGDSCAMVVCCTGMHSNDGYRGYAVRVLPIQR